MATEAQIASLKKAREARALKKELGIVDVPKICQTPSDDKSVWLQALLTTIQTKSVVHSSQLADCIPIADAVLKMFNDKFK